jgi:hypothetical protein
MSLVPMLTLVGVLGESSGPPPDAGIIALCIPVVAIIFGSITMIVRSVIKHRERMAKIGMGIDPDAEFPVSQYPPAGPPHGGYPPHPHA